MTKHHHLFQVFIITTLIILLLLQIAKSSTDVDDDKRKCFFLSKRYYVYVVNKVRTNSPALVAHCASKNDDIGYKTLKINDDVRFSFCDNFFSTLFFCRINWGQKTAAFDAFNVGWAENKCPNRVCYWAAKSDGIYLSDTYPPKNMSLKYLWRQQ